MRKGFGNKLACVCACVTALATGVDTAHAQNPDAELRARIERLEKQNEELMMLIHQLKGNTPPVNAVLGFDTADSAMPLGRSQVQQIVTDYLQTQEDEKKAEAKKKQEEAAAGYVVGSDLKMNAKWNNGLQLETANGDFKVKLGGRLHQPWVWVNSEDGRLRNDPNIGTYQDAVYMRRARLRAEGDAWEVVSWVAEYEFANSDEVRMRELYFDVNKIPLVGSFRVGQFVEPIGFESLSSDRFISIGERSSLHNTFFPEYNPGMMIFNQAFDQRVTWQLAVARDDGGMDTGRVIGDGTYNYDARLTCLPWYEHEGRYLLHLGAAYEHRNAQITTFGAPRSLRLAIPPSFRQGRTTPNMVDTGNVVCEGLNELAGEVFLNLGPFSLQSEAVVATMENARVGGQSNDTFNWGWYVQLGYFLTGENMNFDKRFGRIDRIKNVNEPFFFVQTDEGGERRLARGLGAWQLVARYSFIDLNDARAGVFGGSMHDIVAGLNWYLNPNFKVMANYIVAVRSDGRPVTTGPGSGRGSVNAGMLFFAWDF